MAHAALDDVRRLQALTEDLLLLARLEQPNALPGRIVDMAAVAEEQVSERGLRPRGEATAIRVATRGPAYVRGDEKGLQRLLRNLLDNAVRHARTTVMLNVVTQASGEVTIEVVDDGDGIPPADRERIFDRFTRLDQARDRDAGGAGLGLTIARDIATHHHGTVTAEHSDQGARFVVRLPAEKAHPRSN